MTSNAQNKIQANELLALNGLETDENGNKVVIDLPINLPEEIKSFAGQFYELSPALRIMLVDHNGSKEPPQGQERPEPPSEPLRRPVLSVPQAPSVSTIPGLTYVPQSTTRPTGKRGRPQQLPRVVPVVNNFQDQNVPVAGPATQASKPVVCVLGRKRKRTTAKGYLLGEPLPPLQPRQGAKNAPQSQLGVNDLGSQGGYNNAQANTVGVYNTPATNVVYQREWERLPLETRHVLQHVVGIDPPQVTTPRHAGLVQYEPQWGYAPYVQAGSLPSAVVTAGTPSRGFVQQPGSGSTLQMVGSPVIPPPSVAATGTRHVPTPRPIYYASQTYGPAASAPGFPKPNF